MFEKLKFWFTSPKNLTAETHEVLFSDAGTSENRFTLPLIDGHLPKEPSLIDDKLYRAVFIAKCGYTILTLDNASGASINRVFQGLPK